MIKYCLMDSSHVSSIAELEKLCFSAPWDEASVAGELSNELSLWLVALDGDEVVGYVGSQSVMGEADVMNIAVSPQYRRRGIAETLIHELVSLLKEKEVCSLTLEVRASNDAAKSMYDKLGFRQVGRRPGYYVRPKEDALILRKEWAL